MWIIIILIAVLYLLTFAMCKAASKSERELEQSTIEDVFGHRENN